MPEPLRLLCVLCLLSVCHAGEPVGQCFDLRVNIADQREVHVAAIVPDLTSHTLQVDGPLAVQLKIAALSNGDRWITAILVDNSADQPKTLVLADWPWRSRESAPVQRIAFSLCGQRVIALRDAAPGRCSDLLPMTTPDRVLGNCGAGGLMCLGPYEGLPANISSRSRIVPSDEPGEALTVSGTVRGADGKARAGIIVYGYQTNAQGEYPRVLPARSFASQFHGRFRAWARTDAQGRYTFDTIRPGSYGGNPQHIHMHVIEPGCATYAISDLVFADDANLLALTAEQRRGYETAQGGSGITHLRRKGAGWEVTRDIRLGQNIADYSSLICTSP